MRTLIVTLALLLILPLAAPGGDQVPDHKAIQGSWTVLEAIHHGKATPKEKLKGVVVTFKGDQMETKVEDTSRKGTFKLDATKTPKAIDLSRGKDHSIGIYSLEGDTLKLCFVAQKKDKDGKAPLLKRPATFESTPENRQELVILRRMK